MISILGATIAGGLLILAFPHFSISILAWISLLPLLFALRYKHPLNAFLLSAFCGIIFWSGHVYWLTNVPKYTLLHYMVLMPYLGFFIGVFGLMFSFVSRRWGIVPAYVSVPFVWVTLDFIQAHFFWLALPWGNLAHTQYLNHPIIQIASFTGAYGVTFIVVAVNAAMCLVIERFFLQRLTAGNHYGRKPTDATTIAVVTITAVLVAGSLLYGWAALSNSVEGDRLKIGVVQANIPQNEKWDKKYADATMKTFEKLTLAVANGGPNMIAWPETATPSAINVNFRVAKRVQEIIAKSQVPLLFGSAERRKFDRKSRKRKFKYTNSAYLLDPHVEKGRKQRYDKIHLLPIGEYLPAKKSILWRLINVKAVRGYSTGKEYTVFDLPPYKFSAPICWEIIFPEIVRHFVKEGAQFIVNITNAAFFGRSAAPYQVLSMTVFRAVENRVYVVVAANTGISCFIDSHGRVVDRVKNEKGEDIFVQGVLNGTVVPQNSKTFYTLYGDVFAWMCVAVSGVFVLVSFFRRKRD